jgi:hypothetical protein
VASPVLIAAIARAAMLIKINHIPKAENVVDGGSAGSRGISSKPRTGVFHSLSQGVSTLLLLLSFTIAAPVLRADVTVRYKTEVHAQQLPGAASPNAIPPAKILQIKGSKAFTNFGLASSLIDSDKQEVTMLDATHKLFATVFMKDYAGELPSAMPNLPRAVQQILDSMKTDVASR